jgi:hypothetical protein
MVVEKDVPESNLFKESVEPYTNAPLGTEALDPVESVLD